MINGRPNPIRFRMDEDNKAHPPMAPPRTANPRNKPSVHYNQPPQSARAPQRRPLTANVTTTFISQIDSFLEHELQNAHSDSDRVYVYQRAFDYLAQEFQLCRPLLERIKQQYDSMSSTLIAKKREIMTDTSSITDAEDTFSEMVNKMRRARTQEFAKCREESEQLLDEMTSLRLQRSELLTQLDTLATQKRELKNVETAHAEQMTQVNSKIHELMDEIKQLENETNDTKKQIVVLQDKIDKTQISSQDLQNTDKELGNELEGLKKQEAELKNEYETIMDETSNVDIQINQIHKEILGLEREKQDAEEKITSISQRKETSEVKMREMLKGIVPDTTKPMIEILRTLMAQHS